MKGSSALPYLAQAVALIGGLRRVWGCIILLPEATSIQCTLSQSRLLHAGISCKRFPYACCRSRRLQGQMTTSRRLLAASSALSHWLPTASSR